MKENKKCNGCQLIKPHSEFGLHSTRYKKRSTSETSTYTYIKSRCRECERQAAKKYYSLVKDIPEFKEKNAERVRKYTQENREIVNERQRIKRASHEFHQRHLNDVKDYYKRNKSEVIKRRKQIRVTADYKNYVREYRKRNKDKIYNQEKICKQRYHEKNRDSISDQYVINLLNNQGLSVVLPELIKLKRLQIIAKRILKQKENGPCRTPQQNEQDAQRSPRG